MRAARLSWNGERAAQAADEALAVVAAEWEAERFAESTVGARWSRTVLTGDGVAVHVALVRTAPLWVVMEATAQSRVSGSPDTAGRRVARAFTLRAPPFPVRGAITALGALGLSGAADIDGRDILSPSDGCAPRRDSASVPGVYAGAASIGPSVAVRGRLAVLAPGLATPEMDSQRAAFDSAWSIAASRVRRRDVIAGGVGMLPAARPWSARWVSASDTLLGQVVLDGLSSHHGLLLVNGDLVVRGTLQVRGLLVVRGALDVTAGHLDVEGAVVLRDSAARASQGGDGVRVRYSPCAVLRGLASVARPSFSPHGVWIAR
jgi:hypothetical protein